jgi:hypothetical protein
MLAYEPRVLVFLALEPLVLFVSTDQHASAYASIHQYTMRPEAAGVCGLKLLVYAA